MADAYKMNSGAILTLLLILTALSESQSWAALTPTSWAKTVCPYSYRECRTTLEFYFHDTPSGPSPTNVKVAEASESNRSATGFGMLYMADDPLTEGPDRGSKLVGRAQGVYGFASQNEFGLIMALAYTFTDGDYSGSSFSLLGLKAVLHPVREMPVVGGTGVLRMARGYAVARIFSFNLTTGNAVVGYNVTLFHYPKPFFHY